MLLLAIKNFIKEKNEIVSMCFNRVLFSKLAVTLEVQIRCAG